MSDDRLFASNNAIGRTWFFLNIFILAIITVVTNFVFKNFILPDVRTEDYRVIATSMLYLFFAVYGVTFLSLIDRRIYDILGDRDKNSYKLVTAFIFMVVLFNAYFYCTKFNIINVVVIPPELTYLIVVILNIFFICLLFIAGTIKGKISSVSMEEYKRRTRYLK